ncbi:hypothetical protein A6R68_03992 [Neotoma lepida]|uniref:Uncharacterized protein n=1 Tax=Neotoma lepida TaxID=56216 RepID=A0A1A6GMM9_NEOLE|nr:hypothetical protein A6R68_03992 [Neotoma lepida]
MREIKGQCYQPETFACSIEHCSVHYELVKNLQKEKIMRLADHRVSQSMSLMCSQVGVRVPEAPGPEETRELVTE